MRKRIRFLALLLTAALTVGNFGAGPMTAQAASAKKGSLFTGREAASSLTENSEISELPEGVSGDTLETLFSAELQKAPEVLNANENESEYNLWVGNTAVTAANKGNIPGLASGSASYDPATKTLTLNNASITQCDNSSRCLIYTKDNLTIKGNGTLQSDTALGGIVADMGNTEKKLILEADLTIKVPDIAIFGYCNSNSAYGMVLINKGNLMIEAQSHYRNGSYDSAIGLIGMNYVQRGGNVSIKKFGIGIVAEEIWFEGGSAVIEADDVAAGITYSADTGTGVIKILNGLKILYPTGGKEQVATYRGTNIYGIADASGKATPVVRIGRPNDVIALFDDIKANAWYTTAVQYVYDRGIMSGTGSSFKPAETLTREQFVQVLYNHNGKTGAAGMANPFTDVKAGKWYTEAVLWANHKDIAHGYANSGRFGVGDKITREQFAQMLYKYAQLKEYNMTATAKASEGYADSGKISGYAKTAMDWAVSQGIMSGKGDAGARKAQLKLDPLGSTTRAECAQMVMKLLQKNGQ